MFSERQDALRARIQLGSDGACLVNKASNIRWLTGFTGSSGCVLVTLSEVHVFTDGRYTQQVAEEASGCAIHIGIGGPMNLAHEWARAHGITFYHVSFDSFSYAEGLSLFTDSTEIKRCDMGTTFEELRSVKTNNEVMHIREALRITETAFEEVLPLVRQGITEKELAAEIDYRQRKLGAEKSSFETIVAFSHHTSLPHARPTDLALQANSPILMDFGCVVNGYASDMTRMVFFGNPTNTFLTSFDAVREALHRSEQKACAGMSGKALDHVARSYLQECGTADRFTHSLGHGVGLDIHEWPSVSSRNDQPIPSDCIITLEPGVYFPNQFGIRIENMVQLTSAGCTLLNSLSTELVRI